MLSDSRAANGVPQARPCFISHGGSYLFGWHHPARPNVRRGVAAVLCPPSITEYIRAYRAWKRLAEQLADIGFDVCRFDYEGTGDSGGTPEECNRPDAWLRSIERIVKEAQAIAGSKEVVLIGLRAGAMLALQAAAASGGVTGLVLWSPFRSGRACVRELKALARLSSQNHPTNEADRPDDLAVGAFLPEPVASSLERWDFDALGAAPAPKILLVDHDERPSDTLLEKQLEKLGSCVTRVRPAGTAKLLEPCLSSKTPDEALEAITRWLDELPSPGTHGNVGKMPDSGSALAPSPGYRDLAVRFGPANRLFGVLSVPNDGINSSAPAVIFLNTGTEYRVGPHRLYVPLARHLAAQGHFVLRYDLGGIGDSDAPAGCADNIPYPAHAIDDARASVAFIRQQAPGRRVIVAGLCSGGWHAFLAARDALPVDAFVSVNAPLYLYRGDSAPSAEAWLEHQRTERSRAAMCNSDRWIRALRDRAAYRRVLGSAAGYVWRNVSGHLKATFSRHLDGLARDLFDISRRGVTSVFVFSRGETGLDYFRLHARAALRRRKARERIEYIEVEGADHTFSSPAAQQKLWKILVDCIARHSSRGSKDGSPFTRRQMAEDQGD
jgi:alpha-beta hydrolase superfamily lysophospholipase